MQSSSLNYCTQWRSDTIKILNLNGSAHEMGRKHGQLAKEEIEFSLDSYEKLFWHERNIEWDEAVELAKSHVDAIKETNVELLEEIEGIAEGASVRFEDILALNARSEIALTGNKHDGCTSVAVMPPLGQKAYLAQTWDWRSSQSRSLVALRIKKENGVKINMITEGGIIGKIGSNNHGLGVCLNAIRSEVKTDQLPIHLGLREILNSMTLEEAQDKVANGKIASSANMLIAQDNINQKRAINMELSPQHFDTRETKSSYLYHTNHFCSTHLNKKLHTHTKENSFIRKDRMKDLIEAHARESVIESDIKGWLSDHANTPNSICRHKNHHLSDYEDSITAFAVIMNLTDRKMHVMEGQPCNPIQAYNFRF